jgi:hypothetical protein
MRSAFFLVNQFHSRKRQHLLLPTDFQGSGDSLKKDKKRLCGNPRHQKESTSRYGQHQERAEMMIVSLTAQRASFFHAERGYPASSEMVKSFEPDSA